MGTLPGWHAQIEKCKGFIVALLLLCSLLCSWLLLGKSCCVLLLGESCCGLLLGKSYCGLLLGKSYRGLLLGGQLLHVLMLLFAIREQQVKWQAIILTSGAESRQSEKHATCVCNHRKEGLAA